MGKIITILGGCLVAAGGVGYGVYTYHHGCDGTSGCGAKVSATVSCCDESEGCPLAVSTSAGDEASCCPLAAAAKSLTSASADGEECCPATATACPTPAASGAGLQAVAGVALSAGGK